MLHVLQDVSKLLYDRALSYLNVDTAVSGHDHISVAATPLLYHAIYEAAKMVRIGYFIMNTYIYVYMHRDCPHKI